MSTQNLPLIPGLASTGLLWLATTVAFAQEQPGLGSMAPAPASSTSTTLRVLLMSNGTVVRGEITEDAKAGVYRLKCRGGQVPYPRTSVKKAAGTIEEVYDYQVAHLAPRDPDERLKLVRWCLAEHLTAQAREQLAAVLAMCPDDREAKLMAKNMDANAEAAARLDPDVRRTSGEMPRVEAPAALDPRILKSIRKEYGKAALPEIFDLPPAVAVGRANDFARVVHPVLQQNCATCHNEKYQGEFQLVQVKIAKDLRNPDVARANLDATLRLVNPDDPSRSDLLASGLVPHGGKKDAVFKGPNDPQYKLLSLWARSLRPAPSKAPGDAPARAGYVSDDAPGAEGGFGSDRPGREPAPPPLPPPYKGPAQAGDLFGAGRPGASRPARSAAPTAEAANLPPMPEGDFPLPFSVGGEAQARRAAATKATARPAGTKEAADEADPNAVTPTTATQIDSRTVVVEKTDDPSQLPGMNQPRYPTLPKADKEGKAKTKVDPALLEKLMKNRNGAPQPQP